MASGIFVKWGFVVLNPVRRGYGKTGGAWEEDSGRCESPFYLEPLPAIGNDGHSLISMRNGVPLWKDKVEAFLREVGALSAR